MYKERALSGSKDGLRPPPGNGLTGLPKRKRVLT